MITPAKVTPPGARVRDHCHGYSFLQQYIYRESGIVLEAGKQYLLDARLTPIVKDSKLTSINDLLRLTPRHPSSVAEAVGGRSNHHPRNAVLPRYGGRFEALKTQISPDLKTLRGFQPPALDMWSVRPLPVKRPTALEC